MTASRLLRRSLFCLVAASLGACGPPSQLTTNENVFLSGAAQNANGSAMVGQNVLLIRHPDLLQAVVQFTETVATLGLACLSHTDSICRPLRTATTATDGSFSFAAIQGSDTQGSTNEALLFSTFVPGPAPTGTQTGGAAVTMDFYLQHVTIILPTARIWQPDISQSTAAENLTFSWPSLAQGVGLAAELYTVQVTDTHGNVVWTETSTTPALQQDPRVTEDFGGIWTVTADRTAGGTNNAFAFHYLAPSKAFTSTGHTPTSRGASCSVASLNGSQTLSPCPLTDGDLGTFFTPLTCPQNSTCSPGAQNNIITFDLSSTLTLQTILFHQLSVPTGVSLLVDYSTDGSNWLPIAAPTSSSYQVVKLTNYVTARYVRLRLNDSTAEFTGGINEVAFY